jgi:competence protein ComEC
VLSRIALASILCAGTVDASYWLLKTRYTRTLRVTAVDVGHGDCALVEFPRGKRALIDGGGFYDDSFDVGKNVVAPFLWKKRIQAIDFMVLTHPDPDHLNGLKFIAQTFRVKELWDSGQESDSPYFREFMAIVKQKDIRRVSRFRGDQPRLIEGVAIECLHPPLAASHVSWSSESSTTNNLSLVLRLVLDRQSFLFTGDIEREAESELIASGVELESRVIKVPHHGSLTSSTVAFLNKVRPEIALVSAGQRSLSRSSSLNVLRRYESLGCKIFRTDTHGAVSLETDGRRLKVRTFESASVPLSERGYAASGR